MKNEYLLSEDEAAKEMNISKRYLADSRRQGKIKGIKVVHQYLYMTKEIQRYICYMSSKDNHE